MEDVWVDPEFQGQGIGRLLVKHCLEFSQQSALGKVIVVSDPHALGFYQTLGGIQIGNKPAPLPGLPDRALPILRFDLNQTQ